jgi:hypothetical protein
MCLRFMFLLTTRLASWLRLARREETWKTAEILILRHQLAGLQRQQPHRQNLDWADKAVLRSVRDFARKEWPLRGSPADVRRHAILRSAHG